MKLTHYDQARNALEQARTLDEVKDVADKVEAMRHYARQAKDPDMEIWLTEIRLRALRRLGELSKKLEKGGGPGRGKRLPSAGKSFKTETLAEVGLSTSAAHRCEQLAEKDTEVFDQYIAECREDGKPITVTDALRYERRVSHAEQAKQRQAETPLPQDVEIRIGDFREVLRDLEPGSVDLVLTDPPYGDKAVELYRDLGEHAAKWLKPGGSMLAYCGQSVLPQVLEVLSGSLRYWWTLALTHSSFGQQLPGKFVYVKWKPIVWFVNQRRVGRRMVSDLVEGKPPDKRTHEWAQGMEEILPLIESLTEPGDLVVDPFCGAGGWGRLVGESGRRWIGCDLEPGGSLESGT